MQSKKSRKSFLIFIRYLLQFNCCCRITFQVISLISTTLHFPGQIYLDMAVLVEAQGDILDNIESQVCYNKLLMIFIFICINWRMWVHARALMRVWFRWRTQSIMSNQGRLHSRMQGDCRRVRENACALPLLFS